jgi:ribosomal protein S21
MVIVTKRKGESKDSMFRKFTRAFIDEDIINTVKKRQFYKKPSLVRQEEEKERIRNRHRKFRPQSRTQYRKI